MHGCSCCFLAVPVPLLLTSAEALIVVLVPEVDLHWLGTVATQARATGGLHIAGNLCKEQATPVSTGALLTTRMCIASGPAAHAPGESARGTGEAPPGPREAPASPKNQETR